MINKYTYYLSVLLLGLPLVAAAQDGEAGQPASDNPLHGLLTQLSQQCTALPSSLDEQAQQRLASFYGQRQWRPAWLSQQQLTQLREQLALLADDGLQPLEYPLPAPDYDAANAPGCAELLTSHSYLQALLHLRRGRLLQQRLEPVWHAADWPAPDPQQASLDLALRHLENPAEAFTRARPNTPQYQRLRASYAQRRRHAPASWPLLPDGPLLRPQGHDARLPALRARLSAEGYLPTPSEATDTQFDPATVLALQRFQGEHGLQADGLLGPASLAELNLDGQTRRDQLRANLERLRWLADDMAGAEVMINVAAAEVQVLRAGQVLWRSRTQVGRPSRQTPLLSSRITRLTLNPTWTVPPTILREDKLPAIREDLAYLELNQLSVLDRGGNPLDPADVDWDNPGPIMLRQAAGSRNPLGRVALRFANPFSVYLHDTPSQRLFDKAPRTFSSGCVRIEAVDTLLAWLLQADELEAVLARIASGTTQEYRLQRTAPLLIAYWTVEARRDGQLRYAPDSYVWDARLIRALPAEAPDGS